MLEVIIAILQELGIAADVAAIEAAIRKHFGEEPARAVMEGDDDELEDCGLDLDDMSDLDRGAPYIWNRRQ